MQKLINFRKIKEICAFEEQYPDGSYCDHENNYGTTYTDFTNGLEVKCCAKTCPVWKGLKEGR